MAKKAPAFQLYAGDFLTDTMTWTDEQVGVHMRLLCWSWANRRGLPSDMEQIGMIARSAKKCWSVVGEKWSKSDDGTYINNRLEQARADSDAFRAKQKEKSSKAVAARKTPPTGEPTGHPIDGLPKGNPLEGEEEEVLVQKEKERARESKQRAEESFARFWAVYARKEGKQAAAKAWTRLNDEDRAEAEKRAKSFCAARDPAYLPHPATYLNGRRWEDADPPKPAPKAVNGQPTLMSRAEAMEALRKIRAQHGIPVGGFIEAHLIPDEVNKALR